ncbi:uncharacterized protein CDV56_101197 [Aspergillus thermomutatus]|uniref:ER transporter 6TM N-terminal domain-containing protein n=1 Tax=Aspergillus thermomutatus TaxID=41047 RepID=A0A397G3I9_ASPTH|nr:uncharacterized protein CDV56_101197 [Aspergillus thermomutatus]RHZ43433.1 hypothetical protein CDV56_101197 [Aspergillus thermomutatus]
MAHTRTSGTSELTQLLSMLNPLMWQSHLGLDLRTFLMMLKGALPPTIVIAMHQSSAVADITTTIGYLAALMSVVAQALMPRAKFMKIMLFNLLAVCVAASLCCLAVFSAVKAREHSTTPDASESQKTGYNSDACAVSAIWLIVMIWGANTLRAWRPIELQDTMVAFSIFSCVTLTRGGTFVTVDEGLEFIARLLKGFLLGFAIATGVSLFILPNTSRGNVFYDIQSYVAQIDSLMQAQISFVEGTSSGEAWTGIRGLLHRTRTARSVRDTDKSNSESNLEQKKRGLTDTLTKLNALHGKLQANLFYSKDEFAWGKLSADDLNDINNLLRGLLLPLSGMAMLPEILEMIVKNESPREAGRELFEPAEKEALKLSEIQNVVETLHRRLVDSNQLMMAGLHYMLLTLELIQPKKLQKQKEGGKDEESRGEELNPLQSDFTPRFEHELRRFFSRRKELPRALASLEAFSISEKDDYNASTEGSQRQITSDSEVRQEFFLILYLDHLQDDFLKATLELIKFANRKVVDGTMKRNRLIFPKQKTIKEWFSLNSETVKESNDGRSSNVDPPSIHEDDARRHFPDPEHMPPTNLFEKGSRILRFISRAIRSEQSVFGFRVAAAAFSVGILAYLHQTQNFFIRQRCIWAMIVIVIGMNPTSGQTMFGFVARIAATMISLILSFIVWYIVDGKTAGVIVFLYLANVFEYYFWIKMPQYFGAVIVSIVTFNVIIGYELQVRKLGLEVATSNGQPYYPIYLFGPYKLAAVAAGCAISFFWVIFPYPITAKSQLRKALGRSLFVLAKFYSCMHATIELWLKDEVGNVQDIEFASYKLTTARHQVFKEEMMLLNTLRMHSHFTSFEPPIGGKFPKTVYDNIIAEIQRILTSMALMAHTTQNLDILTLEKGNGKNSEDKWVRQLAAIALKSADFRSHSTTSLLCHLSASVMNVQPLPPYLSVGQSFPLARQLQKIDQELLSIRHVEDPAFSAFVALEVLRSVVSFSLKELLSNVKSLVGELSFDFHVQYTGEYAESTRLMSASSEE